MAQSCARRHEELGQHELGIDIHHRGTHRKKLFHRRGAKSAEIDYFLFAVERPRWSGMQATANKKAQALRATIFTLCARNDCSFMFHETISCNVTLIRSAGGGLFFNCRCSYPDLAGPLTGN